MVPVVSSIPKRHAQMLSVLLSRNCTKYDNAQKQIHYCLRSMYKPVITNMTPLSTVARTEPLMDTFSCSEEAIDRGVGEAAAALLIIAGRIISTDSQRLRAPLLSSRTKRQLSSHLAQYSLPRLASSRLSLCLLLPKQPVYPIESQHSQ
jgi:hypothetical protein